MAFLDFFLLCFFPSSSTGTDTTFLDFLLLCLFLPSTPTGAGKALKTGDKIKAICINDGEWVNFTRQYQLIDQLLCVRKNDTIQLKVIDSNGNEQILSVAFNQDAYFVTYD